MSYVLPKRAVSCWAWMIPECFDHIVTTWKRRVSWSVGRSVSRSGVVQYRVSGRQSVEIQFFCQHRDHAGNLLLLAEARVFRPGLKAGGHHVVDSCQNLHDFQLLAKLVEDVAERLNKPGAAPGVSPWVIPFKTSKNHNLTQGFKASYERGFSIIMCL